MKKVECIIMDWAGTSVDYGCMAPVAAFVESFKNIGLEVTPEETRAFMGLTKIEEIRALFAIERVAEDFRLKFGRDYDDSDVQGRYNDFQRVLFATLEDYSEPIPGVVETIMQLRSQGIKVGSTTGYTQAMMDVVVPAAARKGYVIDNCVTSDRLPAGRPYPYMVYQNMIDLAVSSVDCVLKYGDTIAGSNELGLTEDEISKLPMAELENRKAVVRNRMLGAGAHYVVDDITGLPSVIQDINRRMNDSNNF